MDRFEVELGLNDEVVEKLQEIIADKIDISDKVKEYVTDHLDIEDQIRDWMDFNFDIGDELNRIDLSDYIDFDAQNEAETLLGSYNPENGCTVGDLFTKSVCRAIIYSLSNSDDRNHNILMRAFKEVINETISDSVNEIVKDSIKTVIGEAFGIPMLKTTRPLDINQTTNPAQITTTVSPIWNTNIQ